MIMSDETNTGELVQPDGVGSPRVRKPPRHPFRRKPKVPSPVEQLEKVKDILDESQRARASTELGVAESKLAIASFTDSLLGTISLQRGLDILASQLEAETTIFDLNANCLVKRPDGATRQKALELWFHYLLGKPIERRIVENHNIDSMDDLEKKLASSPALRESLEAMLERAKEPKLEKAS